MADGLNQTRVRRPVARHRFWDIAAARQGGCKAVVPVFDALRRRFQLAAGSGSIAAREVIVGTLGTLYGMDPTTHSVGLQAALRHDMTLGGAIALVVFFAFAMQCTSTLAVVRRETNSWKLPALQFTYMTIVAYVAALLTNQLILRLF